MIGVDTNILVSAHRAGSIGHDRATTAIRTLAQGSRPWAIPWSCLHEFLAIVTHPRIFDPPSTPREALDQVDAWLESPTLELLAERYDHAEHLRLLVEGGEIRGGRMHDARIAAACVSHGVTILWTADRDFGRFPQVRTHNPLIG